MDISAQFDAVVLDDADFDAPVYRSFGVPDFDAFPSGSSSWAIDDFEEAPLQERQQISGRDGERAGRRAGRWTRDGWADRRIDGS